jgi:hypothetical protein
MTILGWFFGTFCLAGFRLQTAGAASLIMSPL